MTQEEKQLLVRDICARLPYGLKVLYDNSLICQLAGLVKVNGRTCFIAFGVAMPLELDEIKPYLRSIASMTEEERTEYFLLKHRDNDRDNNIILVDEASALIDWLNAHHFDYRGLIEKGLALEAPEDMYKN